MIYIQYETEDEKNRYIQEQLDSGYYLVGHEFRLDGNYLVFDLKPLVIDVPTITIEERLKALEDTTNQILLGGL